MSRKALWSSARGFGPVVVIAAALLLALAFAGCSDDGGEEPAKEPKTWTLATVPGVTGNFTGVAFGKNTFVAVTDAQEIFSSTDGETWQKVNPGYAEMSAPANYVYFFNDRFVLVDRGGTGGNWATSTNGTTWTDIPGAPAARASGGVAYNNNGKVVIGSNSGNIYVSDDFATWEQKTTGVNRVSDPDTDPPTTVAINWVNGVAYGKGKYVIGGMDGNVAYSGDLENWTNITWASGSNLLGATAINQIVFGGDKFMAVGGNPSIAIVSSDGMTWTQTAGTQFTGTDDRYVHVGYGARVFIATWQGVASYTTDAYNWTRIEDTKFGSDNINAIAYGAGKFVMVGVGGKIAYSIPE
jgi:hypothetical protein